MDSQGLVPLPAKICFSCRKSCKKAPLIACDYCPLLFHQDCLDPPLTAPPTGMWMCPNHPEQFIDWHLVSSSSATERIRLWSRFSGPVDQDVIKAQFLRKVHHKNPPFRYKLKPKIRDRVEIPEMIEYHYRNPPPLLPSLKELLRYNAVSKKINFDVDPATCNVDLEEIVEDEIKAFDNAERVIDELENRVTDDSDEIKNVIEIEGDDSSPHSKRLKLDHDDIKDENDDERSININEELKNLDESLIKLLAIQRLQQIIQEHPNIVKKLNNKDTKATIKQECQKFKASKLKLPSQMLSQEDIEKIAQQFASPPKDGEIKHEETDSEENKDQVVLGFGEGHQFFISDVSVVKTEAERIREFVLKMEKPLLESNIRCRAVLTPIENIFHERYFFLNC